MSRNPRLAGAKGADAAHAALEKLLTQALDRHRAGDVRAAEGLYRQILRVAPSHFDAHRLLGMALHAQRRNDEALASLNRAMKIDASGALVHSDRGLVLEALGRLDDALASHDRAVAIDPYRPESLYNRANTLLAMQRTADALHGYNAALLMAPDFPLALTNRGLALLQLGRPAEALAALDRAVALAPAMAVAHLNKGNAHNALRQYEQATQSLERAVALEPGLDYAIGHLLFAKLQVCDWEGLSAIRAQAVDALHARRPAAVPFVFLAASDSPRDQQLCARIYASRAVTAAPWRAAAAPARERLRVGYLSHGFGNHAIMVLLRGLFEHHDKTRFEIVAFSAGGDASALLDRVGTAVGRVIDVSARSDAAITAAFREQEIDIAVDIDGFTGETRSFALAARPAPIQVSYLGCPGTLGAPWIDYVIADRIVIPDEHRAFYDENVVYLPDSYQVNDRRRRIAPSGSSRADAGLPQAGFVFCSFNNAYKITPEIFSIWMRLLDRVEDSVLWLLAGQPALERRLRNAAAAHGITPERIIFAAAAAHEDHLWRHRLADLFLDTLPYNAHTTGSDALWAGLPVLTCLGTTFAGRVGASLLRAAGLPELIAPSLDAYEALAFDLASDRVRLSALRARLAATRLAVPLFDSDRCCRHIEAAYQTMWERQRQGLAPASFAVEPISETSPPWVDPRRAGLT